MAKIIREETKIAAVLEYEDGHTGEIGDFDTKTAARKAAKEMVAATPGAKVHLRSFTEREGEPTAETGATGKITREFAGDEEMIDR